MSLFKGQNTTTRSEKIDSFQATVCEFGLGVPLYYGRCRTSVNVVNYQDFTSTEHKVTTKSGKSKSTSISYYYNCYMELAIGERIESLGQIWVGDKKYSGLGAFNGGAVIGDGDVKNTGKNINEGSPLQLNKGDNPNPTTYMTTKHPDIAVGYNGLSYLYGFVYLGEDSASVPSYKVEVNGDLQDGGDGVDANPADIIKDILQKLGLEKYVDEVSFATYKDYCFNADLLVSTPDGKFNSQAKAHDIIKELLDITNTYMYWNTDRFVFVPRDDRQQGGWRPDKQVIYDLSADDLALSGGGIVNFKRKDSRELYNHITVKFTNRANDYEQESISYQDVDDIRKNGIKSVSVEALWLHTKERAVKYARALARKYLSEQNQYTLKLDWKYGRLTPGDLIRVTDENLELNGQVMMISDVQEDKHGLLTLTAIQRADGDYSEALYTIVDDYSYQDFNVVPSDTAAPLFIKPPSELMTTNGLEVWLALHGQDASWGGCNVFVSDKDGDYTLQGTHGVSSSYGSITSPMTADSTSVDVRFSNPKTVSLSVGSQYDAEQGNTMIWLDGECMSYTNATLTGVNEYRLTGLIRGQFQTKPMAHSAGARFAVNDGSLFVVPLTKNYLGRTLYFKFPSFNVFKGNNQDVNELDYYTHTVSLYDIPNVSDLIAVANGFSITEQMQTYEVRVSWTPPDWDDYQSAMVFFKNSEHPSWTYADSGYDSAVITQAIPGDTYTIAVCTKDVNGNYETPDSSAQTTCPVVVSAEIPNTPNGFALTFTNRVEASWNVVTNAVIRRYEIRTSPNTDISNVLYSGTSNSTTIQLTERGTEINKVKLYLYAVSAYGKYSAPAVVEYYKAKPNAPVSVDASVGIRSIEVAVPDIPSDCYAVRYTLEGANHVYQQTLPQTIALFQTDADVYDISVCYVDYFGEGNEAQRTGVVVSPYIDPELIEAATITKEKLDAATQEAVNGLLDEAGNVVNAYSRFSSIAQTEQALKDDLADVKTDLATTKSTVATNDSTVKGLIADIDSKINIDISDTIEYPMSFSYTQPTYNAIGSKFTKNASSISTIGISYINVSQGEEYAITQRCYFNANYVGNVGQHQIIAVDANDIVVGHFNMPTASNIVTTTNVTVPENAARLYIRHRSLENYTSNPSKYVDDFKETVRIYRLDKSYYSKTETDDKISVTMASVNAYTDTAVAGINVDGKINTYNTSVIQKNYYNKTETDNAITETLTQTLNETVFANVTKNATNQYIASATTVTLGIGATLNLANISNWYTTYCSVAEGQQYDVTIECFKAERYNIFITNDNLTVLAKDGYHDSTISTGSTRIYTVAIPTGATRMYVMARANTAGQTVTDVIKISKQANFTNYYTKQETASMVNSSIGALFETGGQIKENYATRTETAEAISQSILAEVYETVTDYDDGVWYFEGAKNTIGQPLTLTKSAGYWYMGYVDNVKEGDTFEVTVGRMGASSNKVHFVDSENIYLSSSCYTPAYTNASLRGEPDTATVTVPNGATRMYVGSYRKANYGEYICKVRKVGNLSQFSTIDQTATDIQIALGDYSNNDELNSILKQTASEIKSSVHASLGMISNVGYGFTSGKAFNAHNVGDVLTLRNGANYSYKDYDVSAGDILDISVYRYATSGHYSDTYYAPIVFLTNATDLIITGFDGQGTSAQHDSGVVQRRVTVPANTTLLRVCTWKTALGVGTEDLFDQSVSVTKVSDNSQINWSTVSQTDEKISQTLQSTKQYVDDNFVTNADFEQTSSELVQTSNSLASTISQVSGQLASSVTTTNSNNIISTSTRKVGDKLTTTSGAKYRLKRCAAAENDVFTVTYQKYYNGITENKYIFFVDSDLIILSCYGRKANGAYETETETVVAPPNAFRLYVHSWIENDTDANPIVIKKVGVLDKYSTIEQTNDAISTRLASYSTTSQMNSAINQKADSITSTVNTTITNKLKDYPTTTTAQSMIDQKADSITSLVSANARGNGYMIPVEIRKGYRGTSTVGSPILITSSTAYWLAKYEVEAGKKYEITLQRRGGTVARVHVSSADENGNYISTHSGEHFLLRSYADVTLAKSVATDTTTTPATAKYLWIESYANNSESSTSYQPCEAAIKVRCADYQGSYSAIAQLTDGISLKVNGKTSSSAINLGEKTLTIDTDLLTIGRAGALTTITDGAITNDMIKTGAITANKLSVSSLSAISGNFGTFTSSDGNARCTINGGLITVESYNSSTKKWVTRVRLGMW